MSPPVTGQSESGLGGQAPPTPGQARGWAGAGAARAPADWGWRWGSGSKGVLHAGG